MICTHDFFFKLSCVQIILFIIGIKACDDDITGSINYKSVVQPGWCLITPHLYATNATLIVCTANVNNSVSADFSGIVINHRKVRLCFWKHKIDNMQIKLLCSYIERTTVPQLACTFRAFTFLPAIHFLHLGWTTFGGAILMCSPKH